MIRLCLALLTAPLAQAADDPKVKAKVEEADTARRQGDFTACVKILEAAAAAVKPGDTLEARVHKTLGICQYKVGHKTAAAANFRAAQHSDAKLAVSLEDADGDEAVVMFFSDVTGEKSRAKPLLEEAAVAAAKTEPGLARTSLLVKTNAPEASVLIDGILAGHSGDTIAVDVGDIEIELTAPGYVSQKLKVTAKAETTNAVEVELSKEPKPTTAKDAGLPPMEPAPPAATQD